MKAMVTVDFETRPIARRPEYPPKPVGVSIKYRGKKPRYFAFDHPTGNNSTKAQAKDALRDAYRSGLPLLYQNAKFDIDVAEAHFGLKVPQWDRVHDTLYQLFLHDPHARSLSLKPSAERLLGMPPDEQDRMFDWLVAQGILKKAQQKRVGEHIWQVPGDIVGAYCNGDVVRTEKLHDLIYPTLDEGMRQAYDRERRLMPILLRNEREGIRVNVRALRRDIAVYEKAQQKADAWLRKRLKVPLLNIDSDQELADALETAGIVTEWMLTPTGQRSIAKKNITVGMFKDKRVYYVMGYRNRLGTCLSMFMRTWLEMGEASGGRIYTDWSSVRQARGDSDTVGARTGRLSCSPNFMNVPTDWYTKNDGYLHPAFLDVPPLPMMRQYMLPDEDGVWLHRDYSQQEPRILAHFENDKLCAQYNDNPFMDVHGYAREQIELAIGRDIGRGPTKMTMLGEIYGRGTGSLAAGLGISYEEAKKLKRALLLALPGFDELNKEVKQRGRNGQPIRTWGGRLYHVEPPKLVKGRMQTWEYKLLNYLIQGSASDCTKEAIINYDAHPRRRGRFLVTVHDENNASAPKKAAKQELLVMREAMEGVSFDVPMLSEPKMGPHWGALKKVQEKR